MSEVTVREQHAQPAVKDTSVYAGALQQAKTKGRHSSSVGAATWPLQEGQTNNSLHSLSLIDERQYCFVIARAYEVAATASTYPRIQRDNIKSIK